MLFDLRPGLIIMLIFTKTSKGSDIEDFKSFLPLNKERENYEKSIENSPYLSFTQPGNNFFFKPIFDLGPKYLTPLSNSQNYKETIPMEPILTKYVEADLKQEVKYPAAPAISPLVTPVEKQSAEIIPIAKMGKDTQIILGHAEPLPVLKGSVNIRELLPIFYQFIQPYLPNNAQSNEQKQILSVNPYRNAQRSQDILGYKKRNHRRICGPNCDRRQGVNTMQELLMRDLLAQTPDGGYIPYL